MTAPSPALEATHREAHDASIASLRTHAIILSPEDVGRAFVASLGSRTLALRSAVSSYAVARVMPEHAYAPAGGPYCPFLCTVCGWGWEIPAPGGTPFCALPRDLAWERRNGGIQHLDPEYAAYDLEALRALPPATPDAADWRMLELVLRTPALLAPDAKPTDLVRALKGIFPSNHEERHTTVEVLGFGGVLEAPDYPGFLDVWVPMLDRVTPHDRFTFWRYPTIWWRAAHGVRAEAVAFWFPDAERAGAGWRP